MSAPHTYITNETPTRLSSKVYSLANYPIDSTHSIFVNGQLKYSGAINDYVIEDKLIKFNYDLLITDVVKANYIIEISNQYSTTPVSGRKELIHWCLRKLGAPVIDINLDDDQIEDRVDEALRYFRDYHFDGIERCYLHYQITASNLTLDAAYTGTKSFASVKITGQDSLSQAISYGMAEDNLTIDFKTKNGKYFIPGEDIEVEFADGSTETLTIDTTPTSVRLGNVDTGYVYVGNKVISITNVIPQQSSTIGGNLGGMFDFQYQFALNNMFNLASTDLVTYDIYKRYISMWEFMFRGQKGIRFNKKSDKLHFDMDKLVAGQWIVFEAWTALNPNQYTEIYSDEFVREYSCSLLKQQWGQNLKKFSGIALPGGVTLNGQQIYDEATEELRTLREIAL